jgi:formate dehydrogenase iron-sulfur subunit
MPFGFLIDLDKCDGCGGGDEFDCQKACQEAHGLPVGKVEKLTATNFGFVEKYTFENPPPPGGDPGEATSVEVYVRRLCQHCEDPACASACPVAALEKTDAGPVTYDEDKCLGCRYCLLACPFSVPKYEWDTTSPRVRKCDMCYEDRVSQGRPTACAEACQTGGTTFGDKDELLAAAWKQLNEDKEYVQKIYGMKEAGGTNVLYITKVPFEKLGFLTEVGYEPLPQKTWNVLAKLPDVVSIGGAMLLGIWWITNRRTEVRAYEEAMKNK